MASILHVVNGDATAQRLAPLALGGDTLVWRDILVEGPVAADMAIDALATWRAPWLARRFGIAEAAYIASGATQAQGLASAGRYDEIVLWFEQDLFCMTNVAHLAAWWQRARLASRLSLVFPAQPLGTSDAATLRALFADRVLFDEAAQAAAWWRGFCAADPETFRARPAPPAFFERARLLHLARFPATLSGLGAVETAILEALDAAAAEDFGSLFRRVAQGATMRDLGMGDVQVAAHVAALGTGPTPLVTIDGNASLTETAFRSWRIAITDAGRAVRAGALDRLDAQPLDWWLGGVHIEGRVSPWRWDAAAQEVRRR